ncbi:MAG: branched-chain amino acid ABC transporter permease [Propionibacteriaceae bacterium]|jgi:branched-chain amino acid transport system permease protein|nr:branched-chain amino acid ABC transporter permease [Propionibacteriaceae bacterium]
MSIDSLETETAPAPARRDRVAWLARSGERFDVPVVLLLAGLVVAFFPTNLQFLATTMLIYGLLAMSANLIVGWLGTMTFGHAAFFGAGIYFVALMKDFHLNPLLLVVSAGLVGALFAAFFCVVTLRLSGIAFVMMTMVFGQVLYLLLFTIKALHGDDGIPGVLPGSLFGFNLLLPKYFWWYALAVVGVCLFVMRLINRSTFGYAVLASRDDPVRAAALGLPTRSIRTRVVVLAGFFAGVAGALFVQQQGIASSDTLYWLNSGNIVLMCLVGGRGHFFGPMVGAVVFVWLNTQLFQGINYANLFIGLIFLVIVLAWPDGLSGLPGKTRGLIRRLRAGKGGRP